ncbi:MAG: hypothetical protein ABJD68_03925 [Nakamurella sp.]
MTSTPVLDRAASMTGPSTVLDLPVALAAVRGLTARIIPDRGGPVIDGDHPLGAALLPHAPSLDAWVVTAEPTLVPELRRLARPAVTVVLDHADRDPGLAGADIAIVDELGAAPTTAPQLLHLDADRLRLPRGRTAGLLGFSIDLPRPGGDTTAGSDDGIHALRAGWTWWRTERGATRPVVLLRSTSSRAATRAAHALHRWAASVGTPTPIIRLDITGVCTTIAASTVVTVLYCAEHPGVVEVVVDRLPPTFQGVRVAGGGQPDLRTDVLIRDAHRMVATHIEGGPLTAGARLIAGGWSGLPGPVSVLEVPDTRFTAASHQPGLSVG